MEKECYIDLHTHTLFSDGKFNKNTENSPSSIRGEMNRLFL